MSWCQETARSVSSSAPPRRRAGRPGCRRSAVSSRQLGQHRRDHRQVGQSRFTTATKPSGRGGRPIRREEVEDEPVDHVGTFEVEEVAGAVDDLDRDLRAPSPRASASSAPMQPSSAPWRYSVGWGGRPRRPGSRPVPGPGSRRRASRGSSRARRRGSPGRAATPSHGQVLGGVVAGRPVGPQPVDEREVVHLHDMSARGCWKKNMYQDRELVVGEEAGGDRAGGRTAAVTTCASGRVARPRRSGRMPPSRAR